MCLRLLEGRFEAGSEAAKGLSEAELATFPRLDRLSNSAHFAVQHVDEGYVRNQRDVPRRHFYLFGSRRRERS
jgi:hypothetical protein